MPLTTSHLRVGLFINCLTIATFLPSVLWRCWLGGRKGIRLVKTEWWGAGVVICPDQGADLHMAQLMPVPLTVFCFTKIQIGFTFRVLAHLGSPGERAVDRVCVCATPLIWRTGIDFCSSCTCGRWSAHTRHYVNTLVASTADAVHLYPRQWCWKCAVSSHGYTALLSLLSWAHRDLALPLMLGTKWHAPVTHPPTSSHLLPEDQQRLYLAPVYHSLYVANFNPRPKCNRAYQQPNHWIGLAKMLQYVLLQVVRNMCMIHWNHAHVISDGASDKCFVFVCVLGTPIPTPTIPSLFSLFLSLPRPHLSPGCRWQWHADGLQRLGVAYGFQLSLQLISVKNETRIVSQQLVTKITCSSNEKGLMPRRHPTIKWHQFYVLNLNV